MLAALGVAALRLARWLPSLSLLTVDRLASRIDHIYMASREEPPIDPFGINSQKFSVLETIKGAALHLTASSSSSAQHIGTARRDLLAGRQLKQTCWASHSSSQPSKASNSVEDAIAAAQLEQRMALQREQEEQRAIAQREEELATDRVRPREPPRAPARVQAPMTAVEQLIGRDNEQAPQQRSYQTVPQSRGADEQRVRFEGPSSAPSSATHQHSSAVGASSSAAGASTSAVDKMGAFLSDLRFTTEPTLGAATSSSGSRGGGVHGGGSRSGYDARARRAGSSPGGAVPGGAVPGGAVPGGSPLDGREALLAHAAQYSTHQRVSAGGGIFSAGVSAMAEEAQQESCKRSGSSSCGHGGGDGGRSSMQRPSYVQPLPDRSRALGDYPKGSDRIGEWIEDLDSDVEELSVMSLEWPPPPSRLR